MQRSPGLPALDARIRAAWQTQLASAVKTPGLLRELVRRRGELLPRFAAQYRQMCALPRRVRRALQRKVGYSLAGVALLLALGQGQSIAATINVDATCSLVDAITAANTDIATGGCTAGSGADTIVLQPGSVHTLTSVNNSDFGPTGLPTVTSEITIEGNGSTIERASDAPAFRLAAVGSQGRLALDRVTLQGGVASGNFPAQLGGGLMVFDGALTLTNSTVSGNTASIGGGLFLYSFLPGRSIALLNSTISGNTATSEGGVFGYIPRTTWPS